MKKFILFLFSLCTSLSASSFLLDEDFALLATQNKRFAKHYNEFCFRLAQGETYEMHASDVCSTPDLYDTLWPFFCLYHLAYDPEGCSTWAYDSQNTLYLVPKEEAIAYIDQTLIHRIGDKWRHIPPIGGACDYGLCTICNGKISHGFEWGDVGNGVEWWKEPYIFYRCPCYAPNAWHVLELNEEEHYNFCGFCLTFNKLKNWDFCNKPSIFPGYFNWRYQKYFSFFEQCLSYITSNPSCDCIWPHCDYFAEDISNTACLTFHWLAECTSIMESMASTKFSPYLPCTVSEEWTRGLLIHAYFYSHYQRIFNELEQYSFKHLPSDEHQKVRLKLSAAEAKMIPDFEKLYTKCLQKHPHPKIHYERGLIRFHRGQFLDSLEDISKLIAYAEANNFYEFLTSDLYLQEGKLLNEVLSYDAAITALTKSIQKDPSNKEAYFEKALAYFETGDFYKALSDYSSSDIHPIKDDSKKIGCLNYLIFGKGITLGMVKGGQDSVIEFIPSLLSCFRGLNKGIWACISSPIAISQDMIECAHACLEFIKDNTTKELIGKIVPELQECLQKWEQLDDHTKGRYIGYAIAKYGVDIFMGSGSVKAAQLYRNLRKANAIMTLETASISPKFAQEVLIQASKEETMRSRRLKSSNLKIQWDKQAKHLPGKQNYQQGKSIFEHRDPQKLVNEFAGKGIKASNSIPGTSGYREIVNFKEYIGYHVNRETGEKIATTWGKIHYAKDGVHIVPTLPRQ